MSTPSCIATPAAICCLCKCSLDIHAPHAIVKHDYAHLDCADAYDAGNLGAYYNPKDFVNAVFQREFS